VESHQPTAPKHWRICQGGSCTGHCSHRQEQGRPLAAYLRCGWPIDRLALRNSCPLHAIHVEPSSRNARRVHGAYHAASSSPRRTSRALAGGLALPDITRNRLLFGARPFPSFKTPLCPPQILRSQSFRVMRDFERDFVSRSKAGKGPFKSCRKFAFPNTKIVQAVSHLVVSSVLE